MFDVNDSNLFIASNGMVDAIWHDGDNPFGPDMLETRSTLDRRIWDVLESILPNRDEFECEVCGETDRDEHNDAACRTAEENWPGTVQ